MSGGSSTERVGVLGGTFDPVHLGHLLLADQARDALGLARVLFVPAARPPHKPDARHTAAERRAAMVALAIADDPGFELSRVELDRPGPSYSADTLEQLAASFAERGEVVELVLLLSAESFREFAGWHEPRRILAAARVAVLPRAGYPDPDPAWLGRDLADLGSRVAILDAARIAISGREIRARVAAGRSIRYLVPRAVEAYIDDHSLYRQDGAPAPDPAERTAAS